MLRIGTAGWTIPRAVRDAFPGDGSHLELYAAQFSGVEINSSFYRQHKRAVYARWAAAVPVDFRFSVKLPRAITHDQMLVATDVLLDVFLDDVAGLGEKLGALLVQLPASHVYVDEHARQFFETLRGQFSGNIVCEPRHPSWFDDAADVLLHDFSVARAAADPACVAHAAIPGGWTGLAYYRLHGSPRMYWSSYASEFIGALGERLSLDGATPTWCIFDNTASGAATGDALTLQRIAK